MLVGAPCVVDGSSSAWNVLCHLDEHVAQGRCATDVEPAVGVEIGVDVAERAGAQFRPPAGAAQFAQRARNFEERRRARARIHAAKRPRVVMRAEQHAAIRLPRARHARHDVADRAQSIVHRHTKAHAHRVAAHAIRERHRTTKECRCNRAVEQLKNATRVAP